jgi:hypothetical protein
MSDMSPPQRHLSGNAHATAQLGWLRFAAGTTQDLQIDSKPRISPHAQYKRPDSFAKAFIRDVSTCRSHEVICRRETMHDV